jgi:hypothetical protein
MKCSDLEWVEREEEMYIGWVVCSAKTQERLLIISSFYYQLYSFLFAQVFKNKYEYAYYYYYYFKRHINNGR